MGIKKNLLLSTRVKAIFNDMEVLFVAFKPQFEGHAVNLHDYDCQGVMSRSFDKSMSAARVNVNGDCYVNILSNFRDAILRN